MKLYQNIAFCYIILYCCVLNYITLHYIISHYTFILNIKYSILNIKYQIKLYYTTFYHIVLV